MKDGLKWAAILGTFFVSLISSVWVLSQTFVNHQEHDKDINAVKEIVISIKEDHEYDLDRIEEYMRELRDNDREILRRLP